MNKIQDQSNCSTELYREMLRIRRFEECVSRLLGAGVLGGTTHLCLGQEAVPVGVSSCLTIDDYVVSNHRGHGHLLAKGGEMAPLMAELAGKVGGYCRGKGGSQHVAVPSIGFMGSNGITGGGLPIAVGLALAVKMRQEKRLVVAYLGDGACTTGNFHESLNLAALWQLPLVFVCENNLYAMSNPLVAAVAAKSPKDWASGYRGMQIAVADGQDAHAVATAFTDLARLAKKGKPGFLECETYRTCGHSRSDPRAYRSKEEEQSWHQRDPVKMMRGKVVDDLGEAEALRLEAEVINEVRGAEEFASASDIPSEEVATTGVVAEGENKSGADDFAVPLDIGKQTWSFREAIRSTLAQEMRRDDKVFILGEDIGIYGGAFGVTRGLLDEFGSNRVRQTPISENSFVGSAVGAAMAGMKPVVEIMFADFTACCMDALVNHAAKIRYMYDGLLHVPMVLRTPMGRRHGYGATHSQSPEAFFLHVPGLKVVAPSSANAAARLLRAAIQDPDPVLFFEHKLLYDVEETCGDLGDVEELGVARRLRRGKDVTIIAYSRGVSLALEAAGVLQEQGVSAEIIDLQTLAPLDVETCTRSVEKTGRLLLVSEDCARGGVAAIIEADLSRHIFDFLRAPIVRISAHDVPVPGGRELESMVMISAKDIVEQASNLVEKF